MPQNKDKLKKHNDTSMIEWTSRMTIENAAIVLCVGISSKQEYLISAIDSYSRKDIADMFREMAKQLDEKIIIPSSKEQTQHILRKT